jgi:membrane fusion protein (multidrug efflux system)
MSDSDPKKKALFREEAVAHHAAGREEGDVMRFDPLWVRMGYRLVGVAALVLSLAFQLDEWAQGPAVIRVDGRRMITASSPGSIESIDVKPGERVEENAVLVRMATTDETAELARAQSEFELQLVRMLVDPNDAISKQTLSGLRARREAAKNAVESKVVRAPVAGTVSDVRVRVGQHVGPGEVLCAVVPNDATRISLVAMVPADYRPMLKNGLSMRFELDGFKYEYSDVVVDDVSAEAVGTQEVMRFLGQERADAVHLDSGGKVFVSGRMPASTFESEGEPYTYFDGLTGTAEVRVRREPLLVTLIPALREVMP